jgi:hypothetical protein
MQPVFLRALERVWKILISLKLAVLVIAALAVTLSAATVIESVHDTRTAQYFVYRAGWFYVLLGMLGMNILAVALSRLPWKRKHIPFLLAHAGILMILVGSWITYRLGLDGSLRVSEGEMSSTVELDQQVLVVKRGEEVRSADLAWVPASVAAKSGPRDFPDLGLRVEQFIPDAEAKVEFLEAPPGSAQSAPAVQVRILGAPMGGSPEFWLWAGEGGWSSQKLGPARFLIRREGRVDLEPPAEAGAEARFDFIAKNNGTLGFEALSLRGERVSGTVDLAAVARKEAPVVIHPGWKMPIRIQVKSFLKGAVNQTRYLPRKVKPVGMGTAQPEPAVRISLIGRPQSGIWLGLGDRARFSDGGVEVMIGYFPKQEVLPYSIRLKHFEMKTNPGTMDPAAYSSYVQVVEGIKKDVVELDALETRPITMNEPLKWGGFTFYQASYVPEMPRPTTTILSVNHDPGRGLKYSGSLLLILGSISLYLVKVLQNKRKLTKEQIRV